jgi:hypothetical protein
VNDYNKMVVDGSKASIVEIEWTDGVPLGKRCPICKFRVRGLFHAKGTHHRKMHPTSRKVKT